VPFDGAFSPLHWLIVAVVALLVFGPEELPRLAHRAGELLRELQRVRNHLSSELRDLVSDFDLEPSADHAPVVLPEARTTHADGESSGSREA
jgi:TatA/E family protein of Tat protein translocase